MSVDRQVTRAADTPRVGCVILTHPARQIRPNGFCLTDMIAEVQPASA
jgi:hypothetical protein